ncbi:MAG: 4-(cytidine 5'-diphospho)-2-C-methyl-D-erythritol kinase [Dehalococcoidia bacterium]
MADTLAAPAPAKVNLTLEVLGPRPDGYHELRSVIQTLALSDTVTLRFGAATSAVEVSGPYAAGTPTSEDNLAWHAAMALARRARRPLEGLSIAIDKQIPPAAGLGGGASDAATTLRLLQRYWTGVSDDHVLAAANDVGSDEAALALGGTILVRGRGDLVSPLPPLPEHGVVLFLSAAGGERKTARMFARLAGTPPGDGAVTDALARRLPCCISSADVSNRFDAVARDAFPDLAVLWEDLERRIGEPLHLAGAGPALFWIGEPGRAPAVAARAEGSPATVVVTSTATSLWLR